MRHMVALVVAVALVGVCVNQARSNGQNDGDGVQIAVAPSTIALGSPVEAVTVHTNLPAGIVVVASLRLNDAVPLGVWADDRGELAARFALADLDGIEPPEVVLTLSGVLTDDTAFAASDTVKVTVCKEK
jgi:hypothetical protein